MGLHTGSLLALRPLEGPTAMQQMQMIQQAAEAGGKVAPLAKALPEEARALANAEVE